MSAQIPVVFSPAGQDACAFYRMWIPHLNIPFSDYYFTGWNTDGTPKRLDLNRVADKRIVIVQRQASIFNLKAIESMKQIGLKVVYDLDDNLWNLPQGNPAKKTFEQHQAGFSMCAAKADILTVSTMGLKTAASVSLPNKEIIVVPNAIDFNLFKRKEIQRDDDLVVIGWGGSNTHLDDTRHVFDILPQVLDECPKAMMEIVGAPPKKEATQSVRCLEVKRREETTKRGDKEVKQMVPYALVVEDLKTKKRSEEPYVGFTIIKSVRKGKTSQPCSMPLKAEEADKLVGIVLNRQVLIDSTLAMHPRYRFKMWTPIREYANRFSSWSWDIAIAPLEDYRFNKSKSNIKMLEAAAFQIPCLVSNIQPYFEFCSLGGEDLKWLLCHNIEEWKSKLICLINEPERRQFVGKKMYEAAKKYYDISVVKENWNYTFRKVLQ